MVGPAHDRTRRPGGMWVAIVGLVLLGAVIAVVLTVTRGGATSDNPFTGASLYVYPDSSAAKAAKLANGTEDSAAFGQLARVPTAIWLLPEAHPTGEITEFVAKIEADAAVTSQLPVFVVYGIPSRDCDNYSAGGAGDQEYPLWISAIAAGIGAAPSVVILEPDALALAPSCGTEGATEAFLKDAVSRLSANPATTIYLDGGHSSWLEPAQMAALLKAAGVSEVRGFATNVSNFNTTQDERDYATAVSELLGEAHFVIDTSRNGMGSSGEWCNPPGRTVGAAPTGVDDGSAQDASLWIKNPGESDGECNGGPPAGQWWPSQALELARGGV
jgi:endoglucanase